MELKTNFWIEATLKYRITFLFIMEIDSVTFALILVGWSKIEAGLMELWYSEIVVSVTFALISKADFKVSPRGKRCQNINTTLLLFERISNCSFLKRGCFWLIAVHYLSKNNFWIVSAALIVTSTVLQYLCIY